MQPSNPKASRICRLLLVVLVVNMVTLLALISYYSDATPGQVKKNVEDYSKAFLNNDKTESWEPEIFKFKDSELAYKILTELDRYQPLPFWMLKQFNIKRKYLSIIKEDDYCDKSRKFFTENPEELFTKMNIMTDHSGVTLLRREVVQAIGRDMHPEIHKNLPRQYRLNQDYFHLKPEIGLYFTKLIGGFHLNYFLNKHFACNHQLYNHIYGGNEMSKKSTLGGNYQTYLKTVKPECLEKFMPDNYLLKKKFQCQRFFKYLDTAAYKEEKRLHKYVFFKKRGGGAHMGSGVYLFGDAAEKKLRRQYRNGQLCGKIEADYQMQKYIQDPLLLYKHKFDFRVYMLVVSTNPLIVYYHDGFLKLSLHEYKPNSQNRGAHLANTELAKEIFKKAANGGWNGMDETQLRAFQTWMYQRLQDYLIETKKINDTNWLETSLRPQMKKAMIHAVRMSSHGFVKRSNLYGLFGVDFLLDNNLKLWMIEINSGPALEAPTEERAKLLVSMAKDHFEVMFLHLRSRMKRVIEMINRVGRELPSRFNFKRTVYLPKLRQLKKEFDHINQNKLEPEFAIPPSNGFKLILDENLKGTARFAGLLPEGCI